VTRAQLLELVDALQAKGVPISLTISLAGLEPDRPTHPYTDDSGVSAWPEGEQVYDLSAYVGKRGGG
jgi:hypothetical protein